MSYDIEFQVKTEYGDYIKIGEPTHASPTYNIGNMLRTAMDWDFKQFETYKVSEILPKLELGLTQLKQNPENYRQYEPENKWGTVETAVETLNSILEFIYDTNIPLEYLYMIW